MYVVLFQVGDTCYDNKQLYKSSSEQYRMMKFTYWSETGLFLLFAYIQSLSKKYAPILIVKKYTLYNSEEGDFFGCAEAVVCAAYLTIINA